MRLEPGQSFCECRILRPIGVGAVGEVYEARDLKTGVNVAIKVVRRELWQDPASAARIRREGELAAQVDHPNVARFIAIRNDQEEIALVFELIAGSDLAEKIAMRDLSLGDALRILESVAAALRAVHKKNIVHRDLTPRNIRVRPDGSATIVDLGCGRYHLIGPDAATVRR
jgi:serine/threonine protein kinase